MRLAPIQLVVFVALATTATGLRGADAKPNLPNAAITALANGSDIQKLIQQFNLRRDSLLSDRQALLNQLKSATAEQRKEILQKMEAQQKDLLEAQRALGKQIRDDMRKLRQSATGPGRHG